MKKIIASLVALSAISAYAQEDTSYRRTASRVFLAPDAYYMKNTYTNNTSQSGGLGGVKFGYDFSKDFLPYVGVSVNWAQGRVTGTAGNNTTKEAWGEFRLGYKLPIGEKRNFSVTPFAGYGYYVFLQDQVSSAKFRYRFMFAPFGLRVNWRVASWFAWELQGMYGVPFSSKWSVHQHHTGSTSYIAGAAMPLRFYLHPKRASLDLSLVPYWRQYVINNKGALIGEKNFIAGARLEVGYNF